MRKTLLSILMVMLMTGWFSPSLQPTYATNAVAAGEEASSAPKINQPLSLMPYPALNRFVMGVKNGAAGELVGVYIPQVMALPVAQQPGGQPAFVSSNARELTQFSMATKYGTIGLLAHNYLAGELFFSLKPGQDVILVSGDGSLKFYRIERIDSFRALTPNSPYSNFVDLENPAGVLTTQDVFYRIYASGDHLVFQTCIKKGDNYSWGRLFVTASPVQRDLDDIFSYTFSLLQSGRYRMQ